MKSNKRLSFVFGFSIAQACVTALQGQAATAAVSSNEAKEVVKMERYQVTGTYIPRVDAEKISPVTVIDHDTMNLRAASQPADLLTALPQVVSMPLNESGYGGAQARGDMAAISIRGLSSGNSLILLNGRRLAPHPISSSEGGTPALSVNANQLPNRGLERVELLRDGASSIYGSDAVAGVVNYILARNFRGTELMLQMGTTSEGDGEEYRATLTHGKTFGSNRGRILSTIDFYKRGIIYDRDRSFSADQDHTGQAPPPWDNALANVNFFKRSTSGRYGSYILGGVSTSGTFVGARPAGGASSYAASSGQFYLVPTNSTGGIGFKTSAPSRVGIERDFYDNGNTDFVIQPESRRLNFVNQTEWDLKPTVTLFADLSAYRADSTTYRGPHAVERSVDGDVVVPRTNVWNPFGERFWSPTGAPNADGTPRLTGAPSDLVIVNKRIFGLPTRRMEITSEVYRGVMGVRGKFLDTWSWETAALVTRAATTDSEPYSLRKSRLIQSLAKADSTAFNPFGYTFAVQNNALVIAAPYQLPESAYAPITEGFRRDGRTGITSGDFRATGDLFPLWGGNVVKAAFGTEYRRETFDDARPPFASLNPPNSGLDPMANDFIAFPPTADTHGRRNVTAAYAETVIPLAGEKFRLPAIERLAITASGRYEKYSDFGSTTKPKVGMDWKPARDVMVRASYNQGFRAPNLAQLFQGTLMRYVGMEDTYRSAVTGLPADGRSTRRNPSSGNLDLKPERATGKTAGFVYEPSFLKGLSLTVDHWEIRQKDVIGSAGNISDDTFKLLAATQAALATGTAINQIDLGSGTASYKGDPFIHRLPVTQADRDFFTRYNATKSPADQRAAVGAIDYVNASYFNKAKVFVSGIDCDIAYSAPRTAVGSLTANLSLAYLIDAYSYDSPTSTKRVLRGASGAAIWRGNAGLNWTRQQWSAGLSGYYIGPYADTATSTTATVYDSLGQPSYIVKRFDTGALRYYYRVRDSISYNVNLGYRIPSRGILKNMTVQAGVINLFNTEPPLSSNTQGFDPNVYNLLARGRSFWIQTVNRF